MSQYAFYLAKKRECPNSYYIFDKKSIDRHNGFELDSIFGIKLKDDLKHRLLSFIFQSLSNRILKLFFLLIGVRIISENDNYDYSSSYIRKGKGWLNFYVGGWHSEKYFIETKDEINRCFSFPKVFDPAFNAIKNEIVSHCKNSVSIHVRRGDYLSQPSNSKYQYCGICTETYYKNAIELINNKVEKPLFFIFSNDLEWCKKQWGEERFIYVDCNQGNNSWRDMYLMSLCKYHINANSTFSWWGAWLCSQEKTYTICPENFLANTITKDFYPDIWQKVSSK